jgi:hypothetical protein
MWPCQADPRSRIWPWAAHLLGRYILSLPRMYLTRQEGSPSYQGFAATIYLPSSRLSTRRRDPIHHAVLSTQPSPKAPCSLVLAHLQVPSTLSTVAWHVRAKRRRLLRAETLDEDFPVIGLGFPRFLLFILAPSTVAKLSPKYLSRHSRLPVTTVAPVPCSAILGDPAVDDKGSCSLVPVALLLSFSK